MLYKNGFSLLNQKLFTQGWDMLYKQDGPLISKEVVHRTPLHCLEMHEQGSHLLVGRDDGAVTLLELSESLSTSTKASPSINSSKG